MDIKYEIVLTANRFLKKFDPDFFNPSQLQEFLIYLPTEEKYIATDRIEYRVGEAPFNILGNYGIYITDTLEYYFSKIVQSDPNFSSIKRIVDISFDDDLLSQAMQTKMTITDLKREARKDPRWDQTENALKTYADAGTNLLTMFGLR